MCASVCGVLLRFEPASHQSDITIDETLEALRYKNIGHYTDATTMLRYRKINMIAAKAIVLKCNLILKTMLQTSLCNGNIYSVFDSLAPLSAVVY